MNLVKDEWTSNDIIKFQKYLKSFEVNERKEWTKNIVNTNLKVLAIKRSNIKNIVKEIHKGNYESFINLWLWEYYENVSIIGDLICKIKNIELMKSYLDIYTKKIDNWGNCDSLSFNTKNNKEKFFALSKKYVKSNYVFQRRVGLKILFKFIDDENYIEKVFKIINSFYCEKEYYVNMINSWLLCECFIKQRDKTIRYLKTNELNKFTINKFIQKCRESYRVSEVDKKYLLNYKII